MGNRPRRCKVCDAGTTPTAPISKRGLCQKCSAERLVAAQQSMAKREGEAYERWVEGVTKGARAGGRK